MPVPNGLMPVQNHNPLHAGMWHAHLVRTENHFTRSNDTVLPFNEMWPTW